MSDIRAAANGRWYQILTGLGADPQALDGKNRPCPACGGDDRFYFDDEGGRGTHGCRHCGAGDGFELVKKMFNYSQFPDAAKAVGGVIGFDGKPPSKKDQAAYQHKVAARRKQDEKEKAEKQRLAALVAQAEWEAGTPASDDHPYLMARGVQAHGLRVAGDNLLIPVRINGEISSVQRIDHSFIKLNTNGGKMAGGHHSIAGVDGCGADRIYIVEGYATGATVRAATGCHVAIAFNAGNLTKVAMVIRAKLPDALIVIAGDNDVSKTGERDGEAAANAVGGIFIMPPDVSNDWNDHAAAHGLDAVRELLTSKVNETPKQAQESAPETAAIGTDAQPPADDELDLPFIPAGYSCGKLGVFIELDGKDPDRVTHRPIWVEALSRDGCHENWGRLVRWVDHDQHQHEKALPAAMFHDTGNELAKFLSSAGLPIMPCKERKLLQYLAAFTPDARLTAATATGWHSDAFVMPDKTINEPDNTRIIYQSSEYQATDCMGSSGTLEGWQALMRDVSQLVKFAIACSLSAPLRLPTNTAAGGFHFYGRTSQGKTTLLQAACSVWGNGTDPSLAGGAEVYLQRWNATKNGLEGMAASFNDLPLIIDEVGESESRDFGRIVYQLMSGTGKTRADRTGGLGKRRTWRITLLSNGELPVADFIEGAKGGQLVRLVDIAATAMFVDREQADRMKHGCAKHYGHAGMALIESGNLLEGWGDTTPDMIGEAPTPESGRVRDRFRLVAHAGELAIRRGILPWTVGDVLESCQQVYGDWMRAGNGMSDADRGIENVRQFLMAYGSSRFEHDEGNREPIDRAGWFRDGRYHFTDAAFKEACDGVLADVVRKALRDAGLLHQSDGKRLKSQIKVNGAAVRVTSVPTDIFSSDENGVGTAGTVGTGYMPQEFEPYPLPETTVGTAGTDTDPVPTRTHCTHTSGYGEKLYKIRAVPTVPTVPTQKQQVEKSESGQPDLIQDEVAF